ncbi:MAG TPA: hypothetical protein VFN10_07575 [Thermoanaerobaculia bacterium]|nr:hypothetical protein [Thermoanaerobaculia bacterium]
MSNASVAGIALALKRDMSEYDKELQSGTDEYEQAMKPKRDSKEVREELERARSEEQGERSEDRPL